MGITLWLLASSNAYPITDADREAVAGTYAMPQQPDMLVKLEGLTPADMTFQNGFKFRTATQHKYLHRVISLDNGHNALTSMLKADKLAIVCDGDYGSQASDLRRSVGRFR